MNKSNSSEKDEKNTNLIHSSFIIGLDKYFIAGLILYIILGYYLSSSYFTDSINSYCNSLTSDNNSSFYNYFIFGNKIVCNQLQSMLAMRAFSVILFLFGVYVWLMLIYYVKFANKSNAPDQYKLNKSSMSFSSLIEFISKLSIIGVIGVILFFVLIGIFSIAGNITYATGSFLITLNIINAIVILALIYTYFLKNSGFLTSNTGFQLIKNIIFYIPCLFIGFIEGLTGIYNNTSHTTVILLLIEAVVITMYFIIPMIIDYFSKQGGKLLLTGPIYLNNEYTVNMQDSLEKRTQKRESESWWDTVEDAMTGHHRRDSNSPKKQEVSKVSNIDSTKPTVYKTSLSTTVVEGYTNSKNCTSNNESKESVDQLNLEFIINPSRQQKFPHEYSYNYAISFWFYINPQPPSTNASYTKFTNILNNNHMPQILYKGQTNTLQVIMQQGQIKNNVVSEKSNIELQKWNNVILNYQGGTLDVFLNNELISTQSSIVPYMSKNPLILGAKNGIHGGIKNVIYFDNILDRSKISFLYYSK